MGRKRFNAILVLVAMMLTLLLGGSCAPDVSQRGQPPTMADMAAGREGDGMKVVYVQEDSGYEPFLAVSANYKGAVLLLRQYLLDDAVAYRDEKSYGTNGGYYPGSDVDSYLNTVYVSRLEPGLRDKIIETPVSVSTLEAVGAGGSNRETEDVKRKVFLLSATELGIKSGMASPEGKTLACFKNSDSLVATRKDGQAEAYWLRSAYHWDDIQAWAIGADGAYGGSPVSARYSVRPAFAVGKDALIQRSDDAVSGASVYVLS